MKIAKERDVNSWSISHDGRRISEHYSLEEAKNIANLLMKILDGTIEVHDINGDEISTNLKSHLRVI